MKNRFVPASTGTKNKDLYKETLQSLFCTCRFINLSTIIMVGRLFWQKGGQSKEKEIKAPKFVFVNLV